MNPFVFDRALQLGEPYVSRKNINSWMHGFLNAGPSSRLALLHGAKGVGKSSLLLRLEKSLAEAGIHFLRVDILQLSTESKTSLLWDTAKAFSYSLLRQGISPPPIEKAMLVLNPARSFEIGYWQPLLDIVGQRSLLLMLDNADSQLRPQDQEYGSAHLFSYMADLAKGVGADWLKFLLTLRARPAAFEPNVFSPFQSAATRRLDPLSVSETSQLLRYMPAAFVPDAVCTYIHQLTKGHPADVQRLSHSLHERCMDRKLRTVTTADVLAVLAYDTEPLDFYGSVYRQRRRVFAEVATLEDLGGMAEQDGL